MQLTLLHLCHNESVKHFPVPNICWQPSARCQLTHLPNIEHDINLFESARQIYRCQASARVHFSAAAVISRYCFKKPLDLYEMIIVIIAIKTRFGYVAQYDETKINVILLPISSLQRIGGYFTYVLVLLCTPQKGQAQLVNSRQWSNTN